MKKLLILWIACLWLASCSSTPTISDEPSIDNHQTTTTIDEMFTSRDLRTTYESKDSIQIQLNGDNAYCNSTKVQINGTIIKICSEGTYVFSGTLNDGMIIVDAKDTDKLQIVLDNVDITSLTSAPIYIVTADKVFLTLADDSKNKLSNGGEFIAIDENNIDATIFSKEDLTINGNGSLEINSPIGHGIVSKDDLVLYRGTYTINSASHGLDANDSIRIKESDITINSGKDGIHSENNDDESLGFLYVESGNFNIQSEGDGISAVSLLQIENGTFDIITGGGAINGEKQTSDVWGGFMGGRHPGQMTQSTTTTETDSTSIKGVKVTKELIINDGHFTIDSADDAIHSNDSVVINKGKFSISTGDDAIHADETLIIHDIDLLVTESYEGLEALDIHILGGMIDLTTSDDGLNAAGGNDQSGMGGNRGNDRFGKGGMMASSSDGSIEIADGRVIIHALGDGIDANGTLSITGGYVIVSGPTMGDTAVLDYDLEATISGGTFIGTGAYQMAQTFSDSSQGVIAVSVGNQSANSTIVLKDLDGKELVSYQPDQSYAIVILSSPDIKKNETYQLTVGSLNDNIEAY